MHDIKSSQFRKDRTILLDGMTITMKAPGAGTELELSQAQRRVQFLEAKLKAGTLTDNELDQLEALEVRVLDIYSHIMTDGTDDNHKVKAWLAETPTSVLQAVFDDMKRQFEEGDAEPKS